MSSRRAGVRVRGTCAAGHVTETTSAPGRVTWQGTCAHDGCDKPVNAKRIREGSPPPAGDVAEHTGQPDDPYAVREVGAYRARNDEQPPGEQPAAADPADPGNDGQQPAQRRGGDAGGGAPAVPAEPATGGESGQPAREPGRAGSRLAARFRTARQRRAAGEPDDELIPGIY